MLLRIKILNWERYQARDRSRHKIENPSWLKLHHKFIRSGVWGTPPSTRVLAITLIILCNESGSDDGVMMLPCRHLVAMALLRRCEVDVAMLRLSSMGFLEYQELAEQTARKVRSHKIRQEYIREERAEILIDSGELETEKKGLEKTPSGFNELPQEIQEQIKALQRGCKGEK